MCLCAFKVTRVCKKEHSSLFRFDLLWSPTCPQTVCTYEWHLNGCTSWGRAAIIHNLTPEYNHFEGRNGIRKCFQNKHNGNFYKKKRKCLAGVVTWPVTESLPRLCSVLFINVFMIYSMTLSIASIIRCRIFCMHNLLQEFGIIAAIQYLIEQRNSRNNHLSWKHWLFCTIQWKELITSSII